MLDKKKASDLELEIKDGFEKGYNQGYKQGHKHGYDYAIEELKNILNKKGEL